MIKKIPSFIDLHVHFRDPGFNQKETILTGLKSAYFGGFGGHILADSGQFAQCRTQTPYAITRKLLNI